MPESEAIEFILKSRFDAAERCRMLFSGEWKTTEDLNESWRQTRNLLHSIKSQQKSGDQVDGVVADFSAEDAIWLSVAERSLARLVPEKGGYGPLMISTTRTIDSLKLHLFVCVHLGIFAEKTEEVKLIGDFVLMISSVEISPDAPLRMMMFNDARTTTKLNATIDRLKCQPVVS